MQVWFSRGGIACSKYLSQWTGLAKQTNKRPTNAVCCGAVTEIGELLLEIASMYIGCWLHVSNIGCVIDVYPCWTEQVHSLINTSRSDMNLSLNEGTQNCWLPTDMLSKQSRPQPEYTPRVGLCQNRVPQKTLPYKRCVHVIIVCECHLPRKPTCLAEDINQGSDRVCKPPIGSNNKLIPLSWRK